MVETQIGGQRLIVAEMDTTQFRPDQGLLTT
jgi:hypothetical protein